MSQRLEASDRFQLDSRRVHVWALHLPDSDSLAQELYGVLSPEEAGRCLRFRFEHLRRFYAIGRGALRILLGRYLRIAPADVPIDTGFRGKPHVGMQTRLRFNISHSGSLVLFGFTLDCEIGVDVEQVHPMPDLLAIATRFFCREEVEELVRLPPEERTLAFFRCWTRKEAYLKALGEGLHQPLDSFRVSVAPNLPARIIDTYNSDIYNSTTPAVGWTLHDVQLISGYSGAIAYTDAPRDICVEPMIEGQELLHLRCCQ